MAVTNLPPSSSDDEDIDVQTQHQHQHQHQHSFSEVSDASTVTADIGSWTVAALESLRIAPSRRNGSVLSIPLDDEVGGASARSEAPATRMKLRNVAIDAAARRPAAPARRETQALKGKEGSRHRRRWENDHLLHVPNVQPPLPSDFEVRPTHPVHGTVPYELAKFWDKGLRERVEERKAAFAAHRKKATLATAVAAGTGTGTGIGTTEAAVPPDVGKVPRDLRAKAKRTPAVKSWLRVLEEPVRQFMVDRGLVARPAPEPEVEAVAAESESETDSSDEEIVFVGRNGTTMRDGKPVRDDTAETRDEDVSGKMKKAQQQRSEQDQQDQQDAKSPGMLLDTLGEDESGTSFKRWLSHLISEYYGLDSKSVTVGNPARRVVYVGIKQLSSPHHRRGHPLSILSALPPPLWEMF
ncbi:R3H-associated N-terminal domain-containing protein [Lasiosphaeria ovina]|uniref:R3H-associated N-terminal domain-containing protein n=1 Tax=Lasiosphaeria ovina TaxID=92902 RepID=A0AAE0KL97_9PEZI|nr:R3H-associated N-terminal domain-containing protein [Lasiosphaeria ovina]